jgi:GNAT superfamily N-acetyltransferase
MTVTVRILNPDEAAVLDRVAEDVFDEPVDARWAAEFLGDPRHHLAVAIEGEQVVGFASGVHYVHPDKPPEFWVNEVGVSPAHQKRGVGRRLLAALFERARAVGCAQAWVGTERTNAPARRLYAAAGGVEEPEDFVIVTFRLNGGDDGNQQ